GGRGQESIALLCSQLAPTFEVSRAKRAYYPLVGGLLQVVELWRPAAQHSAEYGFDAGAQQWVERRRSVHVTRSQRNSRGFARLLSEPYARVHRTKSSRSPRLELRRSNSAC